jgi:hypothetical protein
MGKAGYIIIFITITFFGLLSCSEEDIQIEDLEPFINVKFLNNRSLATLNVSLANINSQISVITTRITEIDALVDKTPFLTEKDSLNAEKVKLTAEKTAVNKLIDNINKGLVHFTELQAAGGTNPIPSKDTIGVHQFPLNSNATKSRFFITIDGIIDTIEFEYKLDTIFVENAIKIRAFMPTVIFNSFDSVSDISCKNSTTCISNDASLTIYF